MSCRTVRDSRACEIPSIPGRLTTISMVAEIKMMSDPQLGRRDFLRASALVVGSLGMLQAQDSEAAEKKDADAKGATSKLDSDQWKKKLAAMDIRPSRTILTPRMPKDNAELRFWLQNMVIDHRYSLNEVSLATGMKPAQIEEALAQMGIDPDQRPKNKNTNLRMCPYPGGRHPRSGYIEAAINPQRETKISIFTPWDPESYVVADLPEAIWSNLGLIYLAHTDIQTFWEQRNIALHPMEWTRSVKDTLSCERKLPNGIRFGTKAVASPKAVRFAMWLYNGTNQVLTDLHVQNCLMLKGASGFQRGRTLQENKFFFPPYVAARSEPTLDRWVITAWEPSDHLWANPLCPCIHSDPKFPDCLPGQTQRLHGWLSFYEGRDIQGEIGRIDNLNWNVELG